MSKSKGNFFTFRDLKEQGFSPLAIRYLLMSVPYSKQLNFTFEGLQGAESTVERLRNFRRMLRELSAKPGSDCNTVTLIGEQVSEFENSMDDNFNTANALAAVHNLVRVVNTVVSEGKLKSDDRELALDAVSRFDSVLGIFGPEESRILDADIESLIEERQEARRVRNFARSDEIRDQLNERGIVLEDTKDGVRWKRT
jgi:cysteinyl-tRNA synthetase